MAPLQMDFFEAPILVSNLTRFHFRQLRIRYIFRRHLLPFTILNKWRLDSSERLMKTISILLHHFIIHMGKLICHFKFDLFLFYIFVHSYMRSLVSFSILIAPHFKTATTLDSKDNNCANLVI